MKTEKISSTSDLSSGVNDKDMAPVIVHRPISNSLITFQLTCSRSFFLHANCPAASKQSQLKCDWSTLVGLQMKPEAFSGINPVSCLHSALMDLKLSKK